MIAGFRVERLLGSGSFGAVYEATQLSLGRTVALRLIEAGAFTDPGVAARFQRQQRLAASVHHPNLVPTYEAGEWAGGRFVATRYVQGRSLAGLLEDGTVAQPRLRAILEAIAAALDAAHRAGLVHGRVTARNVFVDAAGTAYLADLGLGRSGSFDADRQALATLTREAERKGSRRRLRSVGAPAFAGLATLAVVATLAGLVAGRDDGGDARAEPPPPVAAGAAAFGSNLASGPTGSVGCEAEPGPNTLMCTLSQASVAGRSMTVPKDGVIRGWAVEGAAGELALQVVGRRDGHTFLRGFSQLEPVPDRAPHAFTTNLRVERGDRVGVLLATGAVIGVRAAPGGTSALRWEGTLPYTPERLSAIRLDSELLLRADIELGARPEVPQRTGSRVGNAPSGRVLGQLGIQLSSSGVIRVEVVRVGNRIAIDAFRHRRRLARIDVPDLNPNGRLLHLDGNCGYRRGFCLRWLNDGDQLPAFHAYRLARDGSAFRQIG